VCGVVEEKNKSNKKKGGKRQRQMTSNWKKGVPWSSTLQIHDGINSLLPSP